MANVLITGATGVLGSALVPLFLAEPETRVTLLMRATSREQLEVRLRDLQKFWKPLGIDPSWQDRIEPLSGDVAADQLGLDADKFTQLSRQITHIIHAAGDVKLNQTMEAARRTAVKAAQTIVELSERCQESGQFRKLEFISTVGVAGRHSGLVREKPFLEERTLADFRNTYEAAKWEAEKLVWAKIERGLPVTIHRPSMIVGDSQSGRIIHFQVFYFLTDFLLGLRSSGWIPSTKGTELDTIPVDYVAGAICQSAIQNLAVGQVLHLCSGPDHAYPLDDLITRLQKLAENRRKTTPHLRRLSPRIFRGLLAFPQGLVPGRSRRFLQSLPFLLDYLGEKQEFDNSRTKSILTAAGLRVPAVDEYLKTVMHAYWDDQDARRGRNR